MVPARSKMPPPREQPEAWQTLAAANATAWSAYVAQFIGNVAFANTQRVISLAWAKRIDRTWVNAGYGVISMDIALRKAYRAMTVDIYAKTRQPSSHTGMLGMLANWTYDKWSKTAFAGLASRTSANARG